VSPHHFIYQKIAYFKKVHIKRKKKNSLKQTNSKKKALKVLHQVMIAYSIKIFEKLLKVQNLDTKLSMKSKMTVSRLKPKNFFKVILIITN
jgi:hypothetical protein